MTKLVINNIDVPRFRSQLKDFRSVLEDSVTDNRSVGDCVALHVMLSTLVNSARTDVFVKVMAWQDKANEVTFAAASVSICGELILCIPYQPSYGDQAVDMAIRALARRDDFPDRKEGQDHWDYCDDNKFRLRYTKENGCLKRDVKLLGELWKHEETE